ncbi:retropepsin-like aspartic protease [Hespellia stercorisuis]|uniref:Aspartyl protease n=1 Tax=Hespellia stercorisuis DSM 15480 TaxID=1121950 RepID=A0A1M6RFQ4_9FIRM|nr:retropepsin-like aspartic protease [Hespellia stercorisuis]SHK31292.1 Aspartyl protease [Hespellia stercorisuis DSM 15480]
MNTLIGLIETDGQAADKKCLEKRQLKYDKNLVSAEYDKCIQRIVTAVDICMCTDDAQIYRIERSLWDTGSSTSCISEKLARKLGLLPIDTGVGVTPTGQLDISYYLLDIYLSNKVVFHNMKVAGFPLERHDVDFLIGMDIISKGDFNIRNSDGRTVFTFNTTGN